MDYNTFLKLPLRDKLKRNLPAIIAYIDGKEIQFQDCYEQWCDFTINMNFELLPYRVKPKLIKDTIIIVWDMFEHKYVALPP